MKSGKAQLQSKSVAFRSNDILTRDMVQELYDFPRQTMDLLYAGYSDGIICGMDFIQKDGEIMLTPGIARINGSFYRLMQQASLTQAIKEQRKDETPAGRKLNLVFVPSGETVQDGVRCANLALTVSEPAEGCLLLAAYHDQSLPRLPDPDADSPEADYLSNLVLDVLVTPWAAPEDASFHPLVFRGVLNLLKNKKAKSAPDCALLFMLAQHQVAFPAVMKSYIEEMAEVWPGQQNRRELFKVLCRCACKEVYQPVFSSPKAHAVDEPASETRRPPKFI